MQNNLQILYSILLCSLMFVSCQQSKPQVFGLYIDGTFEEFMAEINDSKGYRKFPNTIHIDSIVSISDEHKKIYAYNKTIVDLDENTFAIDTINIDILLNKGYIHEFTYTIKMPLSNYQAIRFPTNAYTEMLIIMISANIVMYVVGVLAKIICI